MTSSQMRSWVVNGDIPENVLCKLEQRWPDVKLLVRNHDRASTDVRALCSPLLHSLSFGILNRLRADYGPLALAHYSTLHELKDVCLNSLAIGTLTLYSNSILDRWSGLASWRLRISSHHPATLRTVRAS